MAIPLKKTGTGEEMAFLSEGVKSEEVLKILVFDLGGKNSNYLSKGVSRKSVRGG